LKWAEPQRSSLRLSHERPLPAIRLGALVGRPVPGSVDPSRVTRSQFVRSSSLRAVPLPTLREFVLVTATRREMFQPIRHAKRHAQEHSAPAGKRLVRKKFTEQQPETSPINGTKALPKGVQMSSGPQETAFQPMLSRFVRPYNLTFDSDRFASFPMQGAGGRPR
jgi:hypothetical protein